jgi:hypothetical protein
MFAITNHSNHNGNVSANAFGPRGQAYLKSADHSQGTGNGNAGAGAIQINSSQDRHEPTRFNKVDADAIDQMQQLRNMSLLRKQSS